MWQRASLLSFWPLWLTVPTFEESAHTRTSGLAQAASLFTVTAARTLSWRQWTVLDVTPSQMRSDCTVTAFSRLRAYSVSRRWPICAPLWMLIGLNRWSCSPQHLLTLREAVCTGLSVCTVTCKQIRSRGFARMPPRGKRAGSLWKKTSQPNSHTDSTLKGWLFFKVEWKAHLICPGFNSPWDTGHSPSFWSRHTACLGDAQSGFLWRGRWAAVRGRVASAIAHYVSAVEPPVPKWNLSCAASSVAATFGHCWQMAGGQDRGSRRRGFCEDSAHCLLPVVFMPPTVQELQAQLAGHLLGLNTAVLFSPSIILSIPPVDFANHPSFSTDIGKPVHKRLCTFTAV